MHASGLPAPGRGPAGGPGLRLPLPRLALRRHLGEAVRRPGPQGPHGLRRGRRRRPHRRQALSPAHSSGAP
ncbi:hypothetical protein MICRO11B_410007 [Micrococcus luteus]|nr:hypothetical protein MICRO11B_410007 [Micrococcus luteus]